MNRVARPPRIYRCAVHRMKNAKEGIPASSSRKQGVVRIFAHHLGQKGCVSRPGRSKRGRSPCLTENPTRDELLTLMAIPGGLEPPTC